MKIILLLTFFCHSNNKIKSHTIFLEKIAQKGMTFDHDLVISFPLFSFLLKKEGRRQGKWIAKVVIKSHAFLLDMCKFLTHYYAFSFKKSLTLKSTKDTDSFHFNIFFNG